MTKEQKFSDALAVQVERRIFLVRGQKVMLDADLAMLYGVEPRGLNQAVARNRKRFPADFVFQLSAREYDALTSQIVISDKDDAGAASALRSQIVISKKGRGGRRYLPYAFTEQGVTMLSSVLRCALFREQPTFDRLTNIRAHFVHRLAL